jgi:hypothetical protein
MKRTIPVLLAALAIAGLFAGLRQWPAAAQESSHLAVIWTSADPEVARNVCFMYTQNAKRQKWFDEVRLVVWGPAARLLAADRDLEAAVKTMMKDGVVVEACVTCANNYGVTDQLRAMGIDVKPMGKPLTDRLKQGWKVLTF